MIDRKEAAIAEFIESCWLKNYRSSDFTRAFVEAKIRSAWIAGYREGNFDGRATVHECGVTK